MGGIRKATEDGSRAALRLGGSTDCGERMKRRGGTGCKEEGTGESATGEREEEEEGWRG